MKVRSGHERNLLFYRPVFFLACQGFAVFSIAAVWCVTGPRRSERLLALSRADGKAARSSS
jgi:hypothetical protein